MKKYLLLIVAIIVSSITACDSTAPKKAYTSPEQPLTQLSIIDCGMNIKINAIDDNKSYHGENSKCRHSVLPGNHTVTFQYYRNAYEIGPGHKYYYDKSFKVAFDTQKGHSYKLVGIYASKESDWRFVILHHDENNNLIEEDIKPVFANN